MIRWICGVKISDRLASAELIKKLGIEDIKVLLRRRRLRWAGHVERKDGSDWVKKCVDFNVDGCRQKGRPRKSWMEVVCRDMKSLAWAEEGRCFNKRKMEGKDQRRQASYSETANPRRNRKIAAKRLLLLLFIVSAVYKMFLLYCCVNGLNKLITF